MNGCLTGLVAITAGCATVETWAAVVIGVTAGWFYLMASALLVKLRIDDAVDAIPVHMVGGAWGVISTGLFSTPELTYAAFGMDEHVGWFYEWHRGSGDFTLLGIQIIAVLFIFGWTSVIMGSYFFVLNKFGMFRIDPLEEAVGMDLSRHHGAAYSDHGKADETQLNQLNDSRSAGSKHMKSEAPAPEKEGNEESD